MPKVGIVGAAWLVLLWSWACSVDSKGYSFGAGAGGESAGRSGGGGAKASVGGTPLLGGGGHAGTVPGSSGGTASQAGEGGASSSGLAGMRSAGGGAASAVDVKNCGSPGHDCTRLPNVAASAAGIACQDGACVVPQAACAPGFGHCSVRADDGCEANLEDPQHCGACSETCGAEAPLCAVSAGMAGCVTACKAPASDICANSCVNLSADPKNCGSCGHDCTALPSVRSGATDVECRAGLCFVPPSACVSGSAHCSTRPDDGCEADLTGPTNCGACGRTCAAPTPVCGQQAGAPACSTGCAAPLPELCGTSCVSLASDVQNCGACKHDCTALPHVRAGAAGVECRAGACFVPASACAAGFGHCSSRADDGCEAELSRPETCGRCNQQCSPPTGLCGTSGSTSACSSSCVAPSPDLCASKCVNLTSDPSNCGSCGHNCGSLPNVRAGATGVECRSGACFIPPSACASGFGHCSSGPDDGCETNLTLPSACGSCGTACAAPQALCSTTGGTPTCSSSCTSPAPDLCGSKCVDKKTDPTNCGTCGHDCTALANLKSGAAVQCNGSGGCVVPQSACATGFANCSTSASDTDGCETRTNTLSNCGGCGIACSLPNTTASCATGSCTVGACSAGFADCTSAAGCESALNTNTTCGSCNTTCGTNQACGASTKTCDCVGATRACPGTSGCAAESATSCGASCMVCPDVAHGTRQCLSGGRCDATCAANYLRCDSQPRTCIPSAWSFESNTAEGFHLVDLSPGDAVDGFSVSTARAAPGAGTHSLAVPVTFNCDRTAARVDLTPCVSTVPSDWRGKTLTFQVYLDGPALLDGPKEASAQVLSASSSTQAIPLSVGQWIPVSSALSDAAGADAYTFGFSMYMVPSGPPPANLCKQWSGTIFLDAFALN